MLLIRPVIFLVPNFVCSLDRSYRQFLIRLLSRGSVIYSSNISGLNLKGLHKGSSGVPFQYEGFFWSITHKMKYVGGIVAKSPVGIDVEKFLPRSKKLYKKIATSIEWELWDGDKERLFFRYWTAKEAVLKAECIGLAGLSKCVVKKVFSEKKMIVKYEKNFWFIEHFYFDNHIAAVSFSDSSCIVKWFLIKQFHSF